EFFFSSRRRHTRSKRDWSSDVCSSDLTTFMPISRYGRIARSRPSFVPPVQPPPWMKMSVGNGLSGVRVTYRSSFASQLLAVRYRSEERRVGKEWCVEEMGE